MMALKQYLDDNSIDLLYVNTLPKYMNDEYFNKNYGIESYLNQNVDKLLDRLTKSNINVLDLRKYALEEGMNMKSSFYYGDHHWTNDTGLWAVNKIAETLNNDFNYKLDINKYSPNNFTRLDLPHSWVGEQSLKLGLTNSIWDNYTLLYPNYNTDYNLTIYGTIINNATGDFNIFINHPILKYPLEKADYVSFHYVYLYQANTGIFITNNLENTKRILLVGDSFSHNIAPFLSLGLTEVDIMDIRKYEPSPEHSLEKYLSERLDMYDAVIVCYSPTMIGVHEDIEDGNGLPFHFFDSIK